ncbi:MAG: aldo/keto reductase [Alphaproteobacteria bacterium]|nr:aldo/keto reductase [Alphaproteobacteria bacterium]
MQKRPLGKSGISIAPLALGGNVFGWTIDEKTSFSILDAFVDFGFNLIDTADIYSAWVSGNKGGESETIVGNWLKKSGKRDKIVLTTKVGMRMGDGSMGLKRDYILESIEASLKRLQTDYVDFYQSHKDDIDAPMEETLEAYDILIKQGKVRAIGASNYKANRLREVLGISLEKQYPAYVSLQPHYNLCNRFEFETELESLCLEQNLAVISYSSLANGFLTGKYRCEADLQKSARGEYVSKYLNERGFKILEALDKVSDTYQTTPAAIALAWLMQRKSITAPIVSATSVSQLSDLVKSVDIILSPESNVILNEASQF